MKIRSVFTGIIAGLLFGIATPLSKIILSDLNSFQLAGLLYFGAAIAYLPFLAKYGKRELSALKKTGKKLQLSGIVLFGGILGPLFLMIGLKTANATSVSIWLNLELVATAVLGVLFFRDHLDRYAIIGLLLTLAAGILITVQESGSGIFSGVFILMACIFWGLDNHLSAVVDGVSPQTITFVKGLFGGVTNLTIGMFLGTRLLHPEYIPAALIIGVFSYGVSIVLYVKASQNLGATRSQMLFATAPFWGILTACIILGEPYSLILLVSFGLLAGGILMMNLISHAHEHIHKKMIHIHEHSHDDGHHFHFHEGESNTNLKHSHLHEHKEGKHTHKHFPDLHHRHDH
jgi:drug/metabolite transporter (DMT)-like permease